MSAEHGRIRAVRALTVLDRRGFLRCAGLVAGAAALPAGCRVDAPAGAVAGALTPRTHAVLVAAAERIVGPAGGAAIAAGRVDPGDAVGALLAGAPELADTLRRALWVLEFGVWPLLGKLRPFTALDGPDRDAILSELARSRFATKRALFAGVKSVALLGFYGSDARQPVESQPYTAGVQVGDAMAGAQDLPARPAPRG